MTRPYWYEWTNEISSTFAKLFHLSKVHPVLCSGCAQALAQRSDVCKEPNKHIKSASFLIKPDFIIIIAIVFHKPGQKVTLGPYLYILVHDTTEEHSEQQNTARKIFTALKVNKRIHIIIRIVGVIQHQIA